MRPPTYRYTPRPQSVSRIYPVPDRLSLPTNIRLTDRETGVLRLLLKAYPDKLIATTLSVSVPTVKDTLTALYLAYGVRGRVELAIKALGCPVKADRDGETGRML